MVARAVYIFLNVCSQFLAEGCCIRLNESVCLWRKCSLQSVSIIDGVVGHSPHCRHKDHSLAQIIPLIVVLLCTKLDFKSRLFSCLDDDCLLLNYLAVRAQRQSPDLTCQPNLTAYQCWPVRPLSQFHFILTSSCLFQFGHLKRTSHPVEMTNHRLCHYSLLSILPINTESQCAQY